MNRGIKKEPAFDVKQAIQKIASQLEARFDDGEEQAKTGLPVMNEQDDGMIPRTRFIGEVKREAVNVDKAMQYIRDKIREKNNLERQVTQGNNIMWQIGEQKTDGAGYSYKSILKDNKNANEEISYGIAWGNVIDNNTGYGNNSNLVQMVSIPTNDIAFSHEGEMQKNDLQPVQSIEEWINRIHSKYGTTTYSSRDNGLDEAKIREDAWQQLTVGADGILGYEPEFYGELINYVIKEYDKEIRIALNVAQGLLENMALSVAELAIKLLPPKIKIGGLVVFASIGVYRCAKKAYEKWYSNVSEYMNQNYCSEEKAKQKINFVEIFFTELMIFFTGKWLEYILRSLGVSERYIIPIMAAFDVTLDWTEINKWNAAYSKFILSKSV